MGKRAKINGTYTVTSVENGAPVQYGGRIGVRVKNYRVKIKPCFDDRHDDKLWRCATDLWVHSGGQKIKGKLADGRAFTIKLSEDSLMRKKVESVIKNVSVQKEDPETDEDGLWRGEEE